MSQYPNDVLEALEEAKKTRERAHAPYSKFKVGVAIKFSDDDRVFTGHNIENIAYPSCACAEPVALHNAIINKGRDNFKFMVLVTDTDPVAAPCGMCRQILSEFFPDDLPIYLANLKGIQEVMNFSDLLPKKFDKLD
jgi:cytidine deaminase